MTWLYFFLLINITIIFLAWALKPLEKYMREKRIREQAILERQKIRFQERELFLRYTLEVKNSLIALEKEKAIGFPWLATAIAEYLKNYDFIFAEYLETKKRPAFVQAEKTREIAEEKRKFKKEFITTKFIIEYYENLFPWLREYVGFNSDELIKSIYEEDVPEENDPVSFYIPKGEFDKLPEGERNQKALDRYWTSHKDHWQIGRDYERYIGYLYEKDGYKVEYHGIEKVKEDLGRDLICIKGEQTEIIQCKNWSSQKGIPIRENHITQLYGTTIKYLLDRMTTKQKEGFNLLANQLNQNKIIPVMVATTSLSKTAQGFASILKIQVKQIPMDKTYPCIKCNINFNTGERIYHLPFDQQYDRVKIDSTKGEHYVRTVQEAETLGFRRAWRWKGDQDIQE